MDGQIERKNGESELSSWQFYDTSEKEKERERLSSKNGEREREKTKDLGWANRWAISERWENNNSILIYAYRRCSQRDKPGLRTTEYTCTK